VNNRGLGISLRPPGFCSRACAHYNGNSTVIASDPNWNLMLVLPLAVRTVMLIVRAFPARPDCTRDRAFVC
jgi:hypothetical protein